MGNVNTKQWDELSILIVGCGSIGKRHARILESLGVKDVRACDMSADARSQMAEQTPFVKLYNSYEEGLQDKPDTVLICAPTQYHIPLIMQAIKADCHVLCEKPIAETDEGLGEILKAAEESGKKCMVALCFRYHEGVLKMREYLKSGKVGRLFSVRSIIGEYLPDPRPDYRDLMYTVFDIMHDLDLAIWMADNPVKKVHGFYGNYSDIGLKEPDLAEIIIDFEDRCVANVHMDFCQRPRNRKLELICTEGSIVLEFSDWNVCTISVYDAKDRSWKHEDIKTERDDMFRAEDKEFLQAVAEDTPVKCSFEEGRKSLDVILAVKKE